MSWAKAIIAGLLAGVGYALADRIVDHFWPSKH
jgi:preprotein translocase subunit SecF